MTRIAAALLLGLLLPHPAAAKPIVIERLPPRTQPAEVPGPERRGVGEYAFDMGQKLTYGVANVIWAPTELVSTPTGFVIDTDGQLAFVPAYLTTGLVYGVVAGTFRVFYGVLDVVTFPYAPDQDPWGNWEWATYLGLGRPIPR